LRQIPVDPRSVEELADAYANDRFLVDGVSEANPRLEILFVRWRKPCRQPVVEVCVVLKKREVAQSLIGWLVPWQHDAVVSITADDEPTCRIHDRSRG
jgi:hypothetical protein